MKYMYHLLEGLIKELLNLDIKMISEWMKVIINVIMILYKSIVNSEKY